MHTTRLKGHVTPDRKLIVNVPVEVQPGDVDVILLQEGARAKAEEPRQGPQAHPAFGLWADRPNLNDPAEYAAQLRRQLESRADSKA